VKDAIGDIAAEIALRITNGDLLWEGLSIDITHEKQAQEAFRN
jgi:hypothetical protein